MLSKDDISVVVRSAGERTASASAALLRHIFPERNVTILESAPFSKAIMDAWEVGRQQKKNWVLCIDADVLVTRDGVLGLLEKASNVAENVFEIQGLVLDKFIPVLRPAGNHLYRTAFTERAVAMIPVEGTSLRPESDMLNKMAAIGNSWIQCETVVGLHDFEQFHSDIFRKCFLQAHKHSNLLLEVEKYWIENAEEDLDFKVALWGALSGKLYTKAVFVDKRFLSDETNKILKAINIEERSPFTSAPLPEYVENILTTCLTKIDPDVQERIFPKKKWKREKGNDTEVKTRASVANRALNKLGDLFIKTGKKLKSGW
jgi:hypothetical protein